MDQDRTRRSERGHDTSYRELFSHPQIIEMMLRDFVGEALTGPLRFDQMERMPTSFTSESMLRREADMLWKIPRDGEELPPLYLFVLLEFQSSVDPIMPLRLLMYVTMFYEHLYKQDASVARASGLPPILPVVLYNGAPAWSAPPSVESMIANSNTALSGYLPRLQYVVVDVGRLTDAQLKARDTLLAGLFKLETLSDLEEIQAQLDHMSALLRASVAPVRDAALIWIHELFKPQQISITRQQLLSPTEKNPMLQETLQKWREQLLSEGHQKGHQEGRQEGLEVARAAMRELLAKLARLKFGEDEARGARIAALTMDELEAAIERILSAEDEEALFAPPPVSP
jgi:hypothetical protein